jgi:hypothetical protein
MPRKIETELTEEVVEHLRSALRKAGVKDLDELTAIAVANMEARKAELLEQIPALTPEAISEYISATAAAIAGEALRPELGRAMLYAAQLAIAARAGRPATPQR